MVMNQAVRSQTQWGNICGDVTEQGDFWTADCGLLAASPSSQLLVVKSCQSTISHKLQPPLEPEMGQTVF